MDGFTATLLICLLGTPPDLCTEATAIDVLSHHVSNEMQCATGWQELAAHLSESQDIGTRTYARTTCTRASRTQASLRVARREHD